MTKLSPFPYWLEKLLKKLMGFFIYYNFLLFFIPFFLFYPRIFFCRSILFRSFLSPVKHLPIFHNTVYTQKL